jgi:hypothetical protein
MSDYFVLSDISKVLRTLLWEAYSADPVIRPLIGSEAAIVFTNPTDTARDSANRLSLWVYQVSENEFLKNQTPSQSVGPNHTTLRMPPLALNLFYLLTPFAPSAEADLLVLGKSMQVFYDNAIVFLQEQLNNVFEELRLVLCRLTLDELTRVWEALREPYRLSVCYQVRVARIDSQITPEHARVIASHSLYGNVPAQSVV